VTAPAPLSGTRERLLEAAERLFAARGFRGVSLRELTAAARVNLAAVSYHFGSKEELLRAVLERRVAPVNAERLRRLDALEAGGAPVVVEAVLEAFLAPAVEAVRRERKMQDVAALLYSEPAETVAPLLERLFGECVRRFHDALAPSLPAADAATVAMRFQLVIGGMVHFLAGRHRLGPSREDLGREPGEEELLEEMIRVFAAGMRAPVTRPSALLGRGRSGRRRGAVR
jgi:AcrR family transcriptional regulator